MLTSFDLTIFILNLPRVLVKLSQEVAEQREAFEEFVLMLDEFVSHTIKQTPETSMTLARLFHHPHHHHPENA